MKRSLGNKSVVPARVLRALAFSMLLDPVSAYGTTEVAVSEYLNLSLEELMQVNVTTVAGTPEPSMAISCVCPRC